MKIHFLFILLFFGYPSLKGNDNTVKIYVNVGYDTVLIIEDVKEYGLEYSKGKVINFRVIDSTKTKNYQLAKLIYELSSDIEIKKNELIYTVIISKNKLKGPDIDYHFQPLYSNSINILYSDYIKQRYSVSYVGRFWFSENSIFRLGSSIGRLSNHLQDVLLNYYLGIGIKQQFLFFNIHECINILSSMDPIKRRKTKGSRSKGSLGIELLIQGIVENKIVFNFDINYYFRDNFLIQGNGPLFSFGIGYYLNNN